MSIDIALVYFRTCYLAHLDAALYSLAQQDLHDVARILVLDNNTPDAASAIDRVVFERLREVTCPIDVHHSKHGDPTRTQSWSVNWALRCVDAAWLFFTRADFLLAPECLAAFREVRDDHPPDWRGFVTSWCYQMGYDNQLSNTDALAPYSLPDAPWRTHPEGATSLIGQVPAHLFQSTQLDAGVWLTRPADLRAIGGLNEAMTSWGFQQQEAQRGLRRTGVEIVNLREYFYMHQHHYGDRNFQRAHEEHQQHARW